MLDHVTEIEAGISGRCNAGCIDCDRLRIVEDNTIVVNSANPALNKIIDADVFLEAIFLCKNIDSINLIGTTGDPMSHPEIHQICDEIVKRHPNGPNIDIHITTNGSLGTEEVWEHLSKLKDNITLEFAIDGLEDTNHIYRRNVSWNSLMRNVNFFIGSGGHAVWKWVDFPHTRHQIDDARKMSNELGFETFVKVNRYSPFEWFDQLIISESDKPIPREKDDRPLVAKNSYEYYQQKWQKQFDEFKKMDGNISPWCSNEHSHLKYLYIEANGTVWPCCYLAVIPYYQQSHVRVLGQKKIEEMVMKFGVAWNNLYLRKLQDIIQTDFFAPYIIEQMKKETAQDTQPMCVINCGRCGDSGELGQSSEHTGVFAYRDLDDD